MQQSEEIVTQPQRHFVRRYWHILCIGPMLLLLLIECGLSVAQSVLKIKAYPDWITISWIILNVLLFAASILLALPFCFRVVRTEKGQPDDDIAIGGMVAMPIYIILAMIGGGAAGAAGVSWITLTYVFVLLILDITDIVLGHFHK